jgi:hypothetical protein
VFKQRMRIGNRFEVVAPARPASWIQSAVRGIPAVQCKTFLWLAGSLVHQMAHAGRRNSGKLFSRAEGPVTDGVKLSRLTGSVQ